MARRRLYVFAYDVGDDRRRYRVSRLLEQEGLRVQDSVFELRRSHDEAVELARRAKALMLPGDSLRVYPVPDSMLAYCIAHGGAPVAEPGEFWLF